MTKFQITDHHEAWHNPSPLTKPRRSNERLSHVNGANEPTNSELGLKLCHSLPLTRLVHIPNHCIMPIFVAFDVESRKGCKKCLQQWDCTRGREKKKSIKVIQEVSGLWIFLSRRRRSAPCFVCFHVSIGIIMKILLHSVDGECKKRSNDVKHTLEAGQSKKKHNTAQSRVSREHLIIFRPYDGLLCIVMSVIVLLPVGESAAVFQFFFLFSADWWWRFCVCRPNPTNDFSFRCMELFDSHPRRAAKMRFPIHLQRNAESVFNPVQP